MKQITFRLYILFLFLLALSGCRLEVSTNSGGTLALNSDSDCSVGCSMDVSDGFTGTFTAIANEGYEFLRWEGFDGCSDSTSCTVTFPSLSEPLRRLNFAVSLRAVFQVLDGQDNGLNTVEGHHFNSDFLDGSSSYVFIHYYTAEGEVSSYVELWEWLNSTITYGSIYDYSYDDNGLLSSEVEEIIYRREGMNEIGIFTTSNTHDDTGNLIKTVVENTSEASTRLVIDNQFQNGQLVQQRRDADADGRYDWSSDDRVTNYQYNVDGTLSQEEQTKWGDFIVFILYSYDAQDRVIQKTYYYGEEDYDNRVVASYRYYEYDNNGNVIADKIDGREYISRDADGVIDWRTSYTYGSNNELLQKDIEVIQSTVTEKTTLLYRYEVIDNNSDGVPEMSLTYVNPLPKTYDRGDGFPVEADPDWLVKYDETVNNGSSSDGVGLNWDGHSTGTCNTCGNMIGEVNSLLLGF